MQSCSVMLVHLLSRSVVGGERKLVKRIKRPLIEWRSLCTSRSSCGRVNSAAVNDLKRIVGSSNVSTNRDILVRHGKDEGHFKSIPPEAVVFAQKTEDVISLTEYCNEHAIPIIPYGAGSGLEAA